MGVRAKLLLATVMVTACAGSSDATTGDAMDAASGTSAAGTSSGGPDSVTATTGISGTSGRDGSSSSSGDDTTGAGSTTTGGSSSGGSSSGSGSSGDGSSSSSTGGSSESGTGAETGGCDLTTPDNTCEEATGLDAVSGDDGSDVSQSGTGSTWFVVQVQETNGSVFAEDLSYTVELESPPSVDYDLFVYEGPQDGDPDCSVTPVQGAPVDGVESVSADWNDDQGLGGEDDSLWLAIEIVHVTGDDCDAPWTLTVTGGA